MCVLIFAFCLMLTSPLGLKQEASVMANSQRIHQFTQSLGRSSGCLCSQRFRSGNASLSDAVEMERSCDHKEGIYKNIFPQSRKQYRIFFLFSFFLNTIHGVKKLNKSIKTKSNNGAGSKNDLHVILRVVPPPPIIQLLLLNGKLQIEDADSF